MSLRTLRQEEFAEKWINSNQFNILNLCPRFGKCRVGVYILFRMGTNSSVLIVYPDEKIKNSWKTEFELCDYNDENITYSTYLSLHKYIDNKYNLVILDECHTLSQNQVEVCQKLFIKNRHVLALTGTLSKETEKYLKQSLSLNVGAVYPIEQAIEEGVVCDYEIEVVKVPLDDKFVQTFGKKRRTEKKQFDALSSVIDKLEGEGKDTFFLRLKRMGIIRNSLAKLKKTKELLDNNERILVFCGTIKIADKLGIPSYHSKSGEKEIFENFCNGVIPQMAVVKIGNTGVTYTPLNRIVFSSFDSGEESFVQKLMRAMSFEYNNPNKVAKITIISSDEEVELRWLKSALKGMDKNKIKYI